MALDVHDTTLGGPHEIIDSEYDKRTYIEEEKTIVEAVHISGEDVD